FVPSEEIIENDYDLSISKYKEIEYEEVHYDPPDVILDRIEVVQREIDKNLKELREMLPRDG
ncbi:MAG: SAM-dependent DNA methyltransferase, partial [Halobacteriota archaeon]|nr:SAM-dependent DNA methyltransferase [Halobacteriota archaeon]